jgi:hypothetical protein
MSWSISSFIAPPSSPSSVKRSISHLSSSSKDCNRLSTSALFFVSRLCTYSKCSFSKRCSCVSAMLVLLKNHKYKHLLTTGPTHSFLGPLMIYQHFRLICWENFQEFTTSNQKLCIVCAAGKGSCHFDRMQLAALPRSHPAPDVQAQLRTGALWRWVPSA